MGCNLYVYYDIDQNAIEEYIKSNNLDVINKEDYNKIIHFCKTELIPDVNYDSYLFYKWDQELCIHKFCSSYPVNFIRDDNRFTDKYHHKIFEKKHGVPFPSCLDYLLINIHNKCDALEIAENLEKYFPCDENTDDEDIDYDSNYRLMYFAKWLRQSAKYSLYYELDY